MRRRLLRQRMPGLLLAVGLLLAGPLSRPGAAAMRAVSFRAEDGTLLAGVLFEPAERPARAVLLVHMLTRTHADWQSVGVRLSEAGLVALALDLRGHGASGRGPAGEEADVSRMALDVRAALAFLRSHPELSSGPVGVAGASIGANLAVMVAADEPGVASLALLSAGIDYRGLRAEAALRKYGARPVFLLAGANDPYAVRSMRQLAVVGTGTRETALVEAGGHGTAMLENAPDLVRQLVDWFRRTLL